MSVKSCHEYAREVSGRYRAASRKEKGVILDEFTRTCGYERKYAIGLLRKPPVKRAAPIKRPRAVVYGEDVKRALVGAWEASDRLCAKRLVPFLKELVVVLERHKEIELQGGTRKRLLSISPATADRLLASERRRLNWRGKTTTKPAQILRRQVEVRTANDWNEDVPGYFEADLVAHCGESAHGQYVNSLVLTDVATGWIELAALPNKSQRSVTDAIDRIRKRLPFSILGIDSDNGTEFINANLYRYCNEQKIHFTRCRPYKKNDQCRVEQKNWSIVRQRIGYARYEGAKECSRLANVYSWLRPFVNYLQPSMKLVSKTRDGAKVTKIHDVAKTPYERLLAYETLTSRSKMDLNEYYLGLNPKQLIREYRAAKEKLDDEARVRISHEATILQK